MRRAAALVAAVGLVGGFSVARRTGRAVRSVRTALIELPRRMSRADDAYRQPLRYLGAPARQLAGRAVLEGAEDQLDGAVDFPGLCCVEAACEVS